MPAAEETMNNEESINEQESVEIPSKYNVKKPYEITRVTESKTKRTILLISMCCAVFFSMTSTTAVGPILGQLSYDLNDTNNMSWYITSFNLTTAIFQLLGVRISDCLGRRRVLLFATFLNLIVVLITGFAVNSNMFIALRAIQGCPAGLIQTVTSAALVDMFDMDARVKYQPYLVMAIASSLIVGPIIGSVLVDILNWRYIFWITAICYVPVIIGYYYLVRIPTTPEQTLSKENLKTLIKRIDPIGCFLIAAGMSLFLMSMNLASSTTMYTWSSPIVIGFLVGFAVLLLFFIVFEKYITPRPLFPSTIILDINLAMCYIQQIVNGWNTGLADMLLYILYQSVYNATIIESTLRLIAPMGANIICNIIGSKISYKIGNPKYTNIFGAVINAISTILLVSVQKQDSSIGVQIGIITIYQAGIGFFAPASAICYQLILEKKAPHLISPAISLGRCFIFSGFTVGAAFSLSLLQSQTTADLSMLQYSDPDTYNYIIDTDAAHNYVLIKNLPPSNAKQTLNSMYFKNIRNIMFANVFWGFINVLCAIFEKIPSVEKVKAEQKTEHE